MTDDHEGLAKAATAAMVGITSALGWVARAHAKGRRAETEGREELQRRLVALERDAGRVRKLEADMGTLKALVDERFDRLKEAIDTGVSRVSEAVERSNEVGSDRWSKMTAVNIDIQRQLAELPEHMRAVFLTRDVADARADAIGRRIDTLEKGR